MPSAGLTPIWKATERYIRGKSAILQRILAAGGLTAEERAIVDANRPP
jgi:hypothetical protein